jgi:hypothetical protein
MRPFITKDTKHLVPVAEDFEGLGLGLKTCTIEPLIGDVYIRNCMSYDLLLQSYGPLLSRIVPSHKILLLLSQQIILIFHHWYRLTGVTSASHVLPSLLTLFSGPALPPAPSHLSCLIS